MQMDMRTELALASPNELTRMDVEAKPVERAYTVALFVWLDARQIGASMRTGHPLQA